MTTHRPAFAARLLKRLLPNQDHDALLGDLSEEYQRGRSLVWYVAQVLAAVRVGSWKHVRARKAVACGAIAAGFACQIAISILLVWVRVEAHRHWSGHPETRSLSVTFDLLRFAGDVATGWLLVSLYRSYGVTMLLVFRAAMLAVGLFVFLWYAGVYAIRPAMPSVLSLAPQLGVALSGFVHQSTVMLAGGYLATRRPESV